MINERGSHVMENDKRKGFARGRKYVKRDVKEGLGRLCTVEMAVKNEYHMYQ